MAELFAGIDIASMLQSKGPVVKCVLLKAGDVKNPPESSTDGSKRHVLVDLLEEVDVDTTPKQRMVEKLLGGSFTFLGQYEDEGIVMMIRNLDGVEEDALPINPHALQPPFEEATVRGDILVMKVAATDETLDNDGTEEKKDVIMPTNDEFFLDYTKANYIAFAQRTDVVAPEVPEEDDDDEECSDEEEVESSGNEEGEEEVSDEEEDDEGEEGDEEDEEWDAAEDEDETRTAMMNLIMRRVLRRFHEGNGRGPNTQELLDLRSAVAAKMGVQVPEILDTDWDRKAIKKKRETIEDSENAPKSPYKSILTRKRTASEDYEEDEQPVAKKVKFGSKESEEEVSDDEKQKNEVEQVDTKEVSEYSNDEVEAVEENRDSSLPS
jgi:hypothetical protein